MAGKRLSVSLTLNDKQFQSGLRKATRAMTKFGKSMQRTGQSLSRNLTAPLVGLGAVSVKTFVDFEQSMLKVKAISGATAEEFKSLEQNAKELGRTTMFTASQVSELQLNLSKLGLTPKQINASTASILQLAQATDSDLAQAATVAASTMKGFGLEAEDMTMISDVMADSFSSTALDMDKFSTAMAVVAPVAKQAGADLQTTTAILGTIVNRGVDASSAGTALRNIFLELSNKGMTLNQALEAINNSTNPLSTAMELFGKRGAAVATIIAKNRDEITELTQDFIDSSGEASFMAKIMDSGLGGSLRRMQSALEGAAIEIGTSLAPMIDSLVEKISSLATSFSNLSEEQKQTILKIAGITAVVGPLLIILGKLVTSITAVGKALIFLAANPMVVFASAVAGLVALLGFAILDLEGFIKTALSLGKVGQVVAKGIIKMASAFGGMNKMEADAAIIIIDTLGKQQEKLADSMEGTTGKIEEQKESIDKLIESMGEMPTAPIGVSGGGMQSTGILNFEPKAAGPVPLSEDALDTTPLESYSAGLTDLQIKMQDTANSFERAFHSMAVSADASFGDMAAAAGNAARQIIKTQIAEATAAYAAKVFSSVPFPFNLALAAAAGSVVGSLFNKIIPPFADGGMVSGATLAMVGEGPGTSAINPEVIAPLDKLQGMIGNAGGQVEVVGKISGSDILLASDRARGNRNRTRGY